MKRPPVVAEASRTEEMLARAARPAEEAMRLHPLCRGKMQTLPPPARRPQS